MHIVVLGIGALRILQAMYNKKASSHMNTKERYLAFGGYFEAAAALFSLVYLSVVGFNGLQNLPTVLCAVIMGSGFVAELLTSMLVMQKAPLAMCSLCALGGGIVLPSIVSIFLFNEPMSFLKWCGVVLFFLAVYFLSPSDDRKQQRLTARVVGMLIVNFLINGMLSLVSKYFAMRVEGGNAALFTCLSYVFASLLFSILLLLIGNKTRSVVSQPLMRRPLWWSGMVLGATCATIVFLTTRFSRVVPLVVLNTVPSAISIIGCLFLGKWFFGEKIVGRQIAGALLGVISGFLVVCF